MVTMLLTVGGCSVLADMVGTSRITTLVQGNIDAIYKGIYDSEYLDIVNDTETQAEQDYLDGMEIEAEYFAFYWGILDSDLDEKYEDLDADFRAELVEMYKEIYRHARYTVNDAVAQKDGSYTVQVYIEPMDIMEQAYELYDSGEYEPLNAFWDKYADVSLADMSDEDYWAYTHEYGRILVKMVTDLIPEMGYLEQKSQAIQVQEGSDGVLRINEDDWSIFDDYILSYS
jgi:hypothetical protein